MTRERVATWASIGTDVSNCNNNLDEILKEAELDYTVEKRTVDVNGVGTSDRFYAVVRNTDNHVYNVVKGSYNVCQNRDAFSIIESIRSDVNIVKAGETVSGMIYMIGELPECKVLEDNFKPYIILQTSHNSEYSLKSAVVPLRVVCQNQFNIAFREADNVASIRHTSSMPSQIAAAEELMANAVNYLKGFETAADNLVSQRVDIHELTDLIFPMPKQVTERGAELVEAKRDEFLKIYDSDDNQNFKGTAWGALNAITDYSTHNIGKRSSDESRFVSSIVYPEFMKHALSAVSSLGVNVGR